MGEGRLPCWNPGLQAVATPSLFSHQRADSLGPLRLDLGCSLTCASGQRVYWSACWSTLEEEDQGLHHGGGEFPTLFREPPPPPPAVTMRSLSLLSVRGSAPALRVCPATEPGTPSPPRDEEPCDLRGWGGWRVTWPVSPAQWTVSDQSGEAVWAPHQELLHPGLPAPRVSTRPRRTPQRHRQRTAGVNQASPSPEPVPNKAPGPRLCQGSPDLYLSLTLRPSLIA